MSSKFTKLSELTTRQRALLLWLSSPTVGDGKNPPGITEHEARQLHKEGLIVIMGDEKELSAYITGQGFALVRSDNPKGA